MQITRIRPDTMPVGASAFLSGMHLMQGEDPELEADAYRKVRAAALEFEDHGSLALITQTIRATSFGHCVIMDTVSKGIGFRLPIGPVLEGTEATASVVSIDGEEHPLTPEQLALWHGGRPILHIRDDGNLPAAIRQVYARLKVSYEAGFGPDHTAIPADITQAIISQAALMQDAGWDLRRGHSGLSPHTARIAARYRGVAI